MLPEPRSQETRGPGQARDGLAVLPDGDCFVLAGSGNRPAQEEIVSRYTPRIYHLFSRVLGDRELAADATQEVFLRVFRDPGAFQAHRSFRSWIFSIAWNHARDQLRRRAVRRKERSGSGPPRGTDDEPPDARMPAPDEVLERRERAQIVRSALSSLEPRQRALLVLREIEELSYHELGELLGLPAGTVKSGVHRARAELREALSRGGGHGL